MPASRTELDERSEKIGYKIREAQTAKIPYMLVVGQKRRRGHCVRKNPRWRETREQNLWMNLQRTS